MDLQSFNIVNFLFLNLIVVIVILGSLVQLIEPYLPVFIKQSFRYGKHSHKGECDVLVSKLELPKSWFKHFYVFALFWSMGGLGLTLYCYIGGHQAPTVVIDALNVLCTKNRSNNTPPLVTLVAMSLITMQCVRRFYETHFVQVFSSHSKINLSHYLVGYIHYFGAVVLILSEADGFTNGSYSFTQNIVVDSKILLLVPLAGLFVYSWYHQFQSNLILANMRKNPKGKIVSEKHFMPTGGYFEVVSSPHMLFECLMYVAVYAIMFQNTSWIYVLIWVLTNQINNALLTHSWYKSTYKDYPKVRTAIIPGLL